MRRRRQQRKMAPALRDARNAIVDRRDDTANAIERPARR